MDKIPDYLINNYIILLILYSWHNFSKIPIKNYEIPKKISKYNSREDPINSFREFVQKSLVQKILILILTIQTNLCVQIFMRWTHLDINWPFLYIDKCENMQSLI